MSLHRFSILSLGIFTLVLTIGPSGAPASVMDSRAEFFVMAMHSIAGVVLNADGTPAAILEVTLLRKQMANVVGPIGKRPGANPTGDDAQIGTPRPNDLQQRGGGISRDEKVVQHVKTDPAGHFNFANVDAGHYTVLAGIGKIAVRGEVEVRDVDPPAMKLTLAAP